MADTTFFSKITRIAATWLNDLNALRYGAGDPAKGAALLQFMQSGAGAVATTVQDQLRKFTFRTDWTTQGQYDTAKAALTDTMAVPTLDVRGTLTVSGVGNSSFVGNVGIGTTTPAGKLTVDGGQIGVRGSASYSQYVLLPVPGSTETWLIRNQAATNDFQITPFTTNSDTPVMTIKNTGNVGIGTTGPSAKLAINGGLHVGGDSDPGNKNALIDGTLNVGILSAFAASDKYVIVDASGNFHKSALGPAS